VEPDRAGSRYDDLEGLGTSMKTVVVIGASSGIGLAAVGLALERGYAVRAFARSVSRIGIEHPALSKVAGDARSAADVRAALPGAHAVIQALGVPANRRMITGPVDLFSAATRVLVPAMQEAGVRRLIAVTGFGAGESRAAISPLQRIGFILVFGRAYADKDIQERLIRDSGLDWVIARPGVLTDGPPTGRYQVLLRPEEWRNGVIARADVADFLVRQLDSDACLGQAPVLVG
jgi:putative NADH-flavin reductase